MTKRCVKCLMEMVNVGEYRDGERRFNLWICPDCKAEWLEKVPQVAIGPNKGA